MYSKSTPLADWRTLLVEGISLMSNRQLFPGWDKLNMPFWPHANASQHSAIAEQFPVVALTIVILAVWGQRSPNPCTKRLLFEFPFVDKSRLKTVFKLLFFGGAARSAEFNSWKFILFGIEFVLCPLRSYWRLRSVRALQIPFDAVNAFPNEKSSRLSSCKISWNVLLTLV